MTYKEIDAKCEILNDVKDALKTKTLDEQVKFFKLYQCSGKVFTMTHIMCPFREACFSASFDKDEVSLNDCCLLLQGGIIVGVEIREKQLFAFSAKECFLPQIFTTYIDSWPEHKFETIIGDWYYFCFGNEDFQSYDWCSSISSNNLWWRMK